MTRRELTEAATARRVVLALAPAPRAWSPWLEFAARVAAGLSAELSGRLLMAAALHQAARLPCSFEVVAPGGETRSLDEAALQRALRALQGELERRLRGLGHGRALQWSGLAPAVGPLDLLAELGPGDILVTPPAGAPLPVPAGTRRGLLYVWWQSLPGLAGQVRAIGAAGADSLREVVFLGRPEAGLAAHLRRLGLRVSERPPLPPAALAGWLGPAGPAWLLLSRRALPPEALTALLQAARLPLVLLP